MVDIVTHAAIGCVLAAPFLASSPEAAAGVAFGSVLPDLDALSRLFGKRAFLACHQTWSHALPVIAVLTAVAVASVGWQFGAALGAGMLLHSLLDLTNTYGIALWLPWRARRLCLEWMFFIDLGTMLITGSALAWICASIAVGAVPGWAPTVVWAAAMMGWMAARARWRWRAGCLAPPGTVALIPSAWLPWRHYGTATGDGAIRLFTLDARTGRMRDERSLPVHDREVATLLAAVPEVVAMRALSPAYHAVTMQRDAQALRIACRDLRVRNFATTFGACDIVVPDEGPVRVVLHV